MKVKLYLLKTAYEKTTYLLIRKMIASSTNLGHHLKKTRNVQM